LLPRRFAQPVLDELRRGITPEKVALTIAAGALLGVFPLLGTTTVLCVAAAAALGLNQAVIQVVNYAAYPLQLPLIYVFVRLGERAAGARAVPFSVTELSAAFAADPIAFLGRFGMTGLHGILGWLVIAVPAAGLIYLGIVPLLRRAHRALVQANPKDAPAC
jgi:uncharacterized protein (DUF2062 family)